MQSKIEWLEEQGWEPVRNPTRKPRRFRVVTGGQAHRCRSGQDTNYDLVGLRNRIRLEDYLLHSTLRRQIAKILSRFTDDEFSAFCKYYETVFLNKLNKKSSGLHINA